MNLLLDMSAARTVWSSRTSMSRIFAISRGRHLWLGFTAMSAAIRSVIPPFAIISSNIWTRGVDFAIASS